MVYQIELSLDIKKTGNVTEYKQLFVNEALKNGCEIYFFNYEFMGQNRRVYRNHYILTFVFKENEELIANFIRFVKKYKRHVYIESIFYDNCVVKIMHASPRYLNIMEKDMAKNYIEKRKSNNLFKNDSVIIKALKKK
jgi:hypothetical protein